jgi:outer membrane lipoprotein LolB
LTRTTIYPIATALSASIGSFLLLIGMSACTTTAPLTAQTPPVHLNWQTREQSLNRIERWQLNGKIGVQTARDSGSATVNWLQNQDQFRISLQGPLGTGNLRLQGSAQQVTLQTADGKSYTATTPEQLLAQQWGFNVPISYLHYWIRGLPVPHLKANTHFDAYGRLSELSQQGWDVQFLSYNEVNTLDLPQKIAITSPNLKVKIVIHQWQIGTFKK